MTGACGASPTGRACQMEKPCKRCGQVFEIHTALHQYCSINCRNQARYSRDPATFKARTKAARVAKYRSLGNRLPVFPKYKARSAWREQLKSVPCADCHLTYDPVCMDFDHRPDENKLYCVGSMFCTAVSDDVIRSEIAKCDIVCSNCHRLRTKRRGRVSKYAKL